MTQSKQVLGPDDVRRAVTRMAHEIIERNHGLDGVALVGLQRGGVWLAEALGDEIARIDHAVPVGSIDASLYRDDIGLRPVSPGSVSEIPFDVDGATVVLVDDVLYTGRTVQAALDAHQRLRAPGGRAAGRARRPRPPRAADPPRLRRQEPAHLRTTRASPPRRAGVVISVKHLRSIDEAGPDALRRLLELTDHMAEVNRRPIPKVPALRGKTVCNVFFEDSTRTRLELRDRRQAAVGRHDELRRVVVERQQGREPPRHDRDDRRDGCRRVRDPPQVERCAAAGQPVDAGQRDQRRRRLARSTRRRRCSTATRSARPSTGAAGSTDCASRSSATSSTAGSRAATSPLSRSSAPTSRWSPRRRCCHRRSTLAGRRQPRSRRAHRRSRRALPVADAARADDRGAGAVAPRVHQPLRPHRGPGRRLPSTP